MSELSDNIKVTFQNLITIYNETSSLLQDADSMLEKVGYHCTHSNRNTIGTERSYHISYPEWWITPYACRFYATQENPDEYKAIGVFFADTDCIPIQPIVLIGCFKMKKNEQDDILPFYYWHFKEAWFHLVSTQRIEEDLDVPEKWTFSGGKVRAVLLENVDNQEKLEKRVIEPLIAMSC